MMGLCEDLPQAKPGKVDHARLQKEKKKEALKEWKVEHVAADGGLSGSGTN